MNFGPAPDIAPGYYWAVRANSYRDTLMISAPRPVEVRQAGIGNPKLLVYEIGVGEDRSPSDYWFGPRIGANQHDERFFHTTIPSSVEYSHLDLVNGYRKGR